MREMQEEKNPETSAAKGNFSVPLILYFLTELSLSIPPTAVKKKKPALAQNKTCKRSKPHRLDKRRMF